MHAMNLQANKGSNGQTNVVALRDFKAALSTFDTRELFETPMVDFDLPSIQGIESRIFNGHVQLAAGHGIATGKDGAAVDDRFEIPDQYS